MVAPVPSSLPAGTVTFLFSDIEDSTRLWEEMPAEMAAALEIHDGIVRGTIEQHGGYVFATGGDGFCAAFSTAPDAAEAAVEIQQKLLAEPDAVPFGVRIGLHTGEATERNRDYFGPEVNRVGAIDVDCPWRADRRVRYDQGVVAESAGAPAARRPSTPRSWSADGSASDRRRWAPVGIPAASQPGGRSPATCLSS